MNGLLSHDQRLRPELFVWRGPIEPTRLSEWLRVRHLNVPSDLQELWEKTGGGDLFESETILSPFGCSVSGDDVDGINNHHHALGLDVDYLIVHCGLCLTAIRLSDQKWVVLDPGSYEVTTEYSSLSEWYREVIHNEYAKRYGLMSN